MYRGKIASKIRSDDSKRIELLKEQHEKVIVIWENEILNNIENITDFLKGLIYENTAH
jgi:very-short-patch-repair endonuclease